METFSALLAICAGIHRPPVNSPHKGQWRGALMFSLICDWINAWVNNREAGDLRSYRAHYDVTVMGSPTAYLHKPFVFSKPFACLGPLLLTCINFNLSLDISNHSILMYGMKLLIHSQISTFSRWSLGMNKKFHQTLGWACSYLFMLELKLNHNLVAWRGTWGGHSGVCQAAYPTGFHTCQLFVHHVCKL